MPGTIGKWTVKRTLGTGASCKVKLGVDPDTNRQVAIKIMNDDMGQEEKELLMTEVEAMHKLQHENIIQTLEYGAGTYNKSSGKKEVDYIVLELAKGGELFDFIAMTGAFSEKVARYYFIQFMNGLNYCHKAGICHRDLKPENLLLDSKFVLKLADFGFAAPLEGRDGSGNLYTNLGTHNYMAPEIHLKQPYKGDQVDLFAAGMILFIMIAQHPPFSSATPKDPYYKCLAANRPDIFWKTHGKTKEGGAGFFSDEFKDIFEKMVALDPNSRLTIDDILNHPWLEGDIATAEEIKHEFKQRNKQVQEEVRAEAAAKKAEKASAHLSRKKQYRSEGGVDDETAALKPKKALEQYEQLFDLKTTQLFSTFNPDIIENTILKHLEDNEIKYNCKKDKYKIKFDLESTNKEGVQSVVGICVRILQVEEEKYVIEFTKTGGDENVYLKHFSEFKTAALGKLNDANLVDVAE